MELTPKSKIKIRIMRAYMIVDEVPFNNTYYPDAKTPEDAVEWERSRKFERKLEEFTDLLSSTPADKIQWREKIEVITDEQAEGTEETK